MGEETIVVVVRHPDFADEIEVFGGEARVVYLDMGQSFDVTRIGPDDVETVNEWAESILEDVEDLPSDHPARVYVENAVAQVREEVAS